ncbi:MAG: methyltransferase domain-containing protein, partial [Prevotella sp.]|nr:methyltransferase domain-containing protein [Prevotella sp.]
DEIPVKTLFREEDEMPEIERKALEMVKGRTLDVGAGAGCHSLILQKRGFDVTAIDISPLSVETMRARGVKKAFEQDFYALDGRYDTVLMLMNGIGIVGTLSRMPMFFRHLDKILASDGQLLCDSSDISYVFENEEGIIELPDTDYYGEINYQMRYRDIIGEPFSWLFIDAETLRQVAEKHGYAVEIVAEGKHDDYLARIFKNNQ